MDSRQEVATADISQPFQSEPEKDNRSVSSAAKHNIPIGFWSLGLLCAASYAITGAFAFGNSAVTQIQYLALSPSRTLAVLRTLSEATSLLLAALIASTTEKTFWLLASKEDGITLPNFLALQLNTGLVGSLRLLFGGTIRAKRWSAVRLSLILLVPVLAVVLLSDTKISLSFHQQSQYPVSGGVGTFNASYAELYQGYTAIEISRDIWRLLQLNQWSYPSDPVLSCTPSGSELACGPSFFLHGGIWLVNPWPTKNNSFPTADAYVLNQVRGTQLDFQPLDADFNFNIKNECVTLGQDDAAVEICVSQGSLPHMLNAKLIYCPSDIVNVGFCLSDTSWLSNQGRSTSVAVYTRTANVNIARVNFTTFSIDSLSPATPAVTSAEDLLQLYNTTFTTQEAVGYASNLVANELTLLLNSYLINMKRGGTTSFQQAFYVLYNLLAIPLLYFQPTYMSIWSANLVINPDGSTQGLPLSQGLYTTASFARSHYNLLVAPWSFWLYTVGTGLILLLCFLVLILATPVFFRRFPITETTSWPILDVVANCRPLVESANSRPQSKGKGELVIIFQKVKSSLKMPKEEREATIDAQQLRIVATAFEDRHTNARGAKHDVESQQVIEEREKSAITPNADLGDQVAREEGREEEEQEEPELHRMPAQMDRERQLEEDENQQVIEEREKSAATPNADLGDQVARELGREEKEQQEPEPHRMPAQMDSERQLEEDDKNLQETHDTSEQPSEETRGIA
jgi:hypothetical protein